MKRILLLPDNERAMADLLALPDRKRSKKKAKTSPTPAAEVLKEIAAKDWLSMAEAMAYLGVSRHTIMRRLKEGILKGKKTTGLSNKKSGGHWRISKASLNHAFTVTSKQLSEKLEEVSNRSSKRR